MVHGKVMNLSLVNGSWQGHEPELSEWFMVTSTFTIHYNIPAENFPPSIIYFPLSIVLLLYF